MPITLPPLWANITKEAPELIVRSRSSLVSVTLALAPAARHSSNTDSISDSKHWPKYGVLVHGRLSRLFAGSQQVGFHGKSQAVVSQVRR